MFLFTPCDPYKALPWPLMKVTGHAHLWGGRQKGYGKTPCNHIESVGFPTYKINQQNSPDHLAASSTIYLSNKMIFAPKIQISTPNFHIAGSPSPCGLTWLFGKV
jgi:hypothetical protein